MISKEFRFYRPAELSELLSLLDEDLGDVKLLAGGMTLVPAMNLGFVRPDAIISLNRIKPLEAIVVDDRHVRLGALVRHRRIETDGRIRAACPLLSEAAGLIADVQVRHRGSVGGSLAHADPAANYIPAMLALGAQFRLVSRAGERWVHARDFIRDALETDIKPSEVLAEVTIPLQTAAQSSAYCRIARVHGSFAVANAAALLDGDADLRVVVCGAAAKPILVEERIGAVAGTEARIAERFGDAVYAACLEPIDDLNESPEYRRSMARVAAIRAIEGAFRSRNKSGT